MTRDVEYIAGHRESSPFQRLLKELRGVVVRWTGSPVSYGKGEGAASSRKILGFNGARMNDVTRPSYWPDSFCWWIDAVGSYLVFVKSQIRIGQAGSAANDVGILGDLRSHHADLIVSSSGTVLVSKAETTVNGRAGESFLLHDGDVLRFRSVEMVFRQPQAWSRTARLEVTSRHRLSTSMDGIILLGETAMLGPGPDAVVRTPWSSPIFLNWYQHRFWVRGPEDLLVDGKPTGGCAPLDPNSRIEGSWGSFRWEPIQR